MIPPQEARTNFEVACSFLGWGDPGSPDSPGIWFIGLEEHQSWTKDTLARCRGHEFVLEESSLDYAIAIWTSKIACRLSAGYANKDHTAYQLERLWKRGSRVCQTNLLPLGKRDLKCWPDHYQELFGFGSDQRREYVAAAGKKRSHRIHDRWSECQPRATVCFGKSHWREFRELFDLSDKSPDPDGTCPYPERRIILIPFLGLQGRGKAMNDRQVDAIVTTLKAWNVTLP